MTSRASLPTVALLLCLLAAAAVAAVTVEAQDKAVERIRKTYEQMIEKIDCLLLAYSRPATGSSCFSRQR